MNTATVLQQADPPQWSDYGRLSKVIQFDQCIEFLQRSGQVTFGKHFKLSPADYKIIFLLLVYFYHDLENAERFDIDLKKGILLLGPVGCGKTSLMYLMRFLLARDEQYTVVSARDVGMEFIRDGYPVIEKYASKSFMNCQEVIRPKTYCFDDLGLESSFKHFGNETNVLAEILLSRYPLFIHQGMKTHVTTNLSSRSLEKFYGNRVRSRMREMFNLIAFDDQALDKRK